MTTKETQRKAAAILRRVVEAVHAGELAASAGIVARLEGAAVALEQGDRRRRKGPGQKA